MIETAVDALIFDMDGTLAETGHIWVAAEHALFEFLGHEWSENVASHGLGMNAADLATTMHRILGARQPVKAAQRVMREALIDAYGGSTILEIPDAVALVRRLHGRVPMAVASGSPLEGIHHALAQLGIRSLFDVILSTESVPAGKPAPDGFLAAAEALGVAPSRCVVFEDSPIGARAAQAAGMGCFVRPRNARCDLTGTDAVLTAHWDDVTAVKVFGADQVTTSQYGR
ncbi:MAG: HAD family phosphatase [Lentisphaeria bacterium]|nr:HAD family phosphatase [Lentisphaeria bacterium]